jgi:hypothetical protein
MNQDSGPVPDHLLALDDAILDDRLPQINKELHRMDLEDDDATDLASLSTKAESNLDAFIQRSSRLSSMSLVCFFLGDPYSLKIV